MKHTYFTKGTCSRQITFELDGNIIKNVSFIGGCDGNLKAVASLVEGLTVEEVEERVKGIKCGFKSTSCSDQLATAVRLAFDEEKAQSK
jgi:uncharacterized protein (TIGR03905 family)